MKKVEQSETTTDLSEAEIHDKVAEFRDRLMDLNKLYKELLNIHVAGDFYIGPNMSYTNLPDQVIFKKTTVVRY